MNTEERLRYELELASAALPAIGIDLGETLGRGREVRRRVLLAGTVASVSIVLAVTGAAYSLLGNGTGGLAPIPPAGGSGSEETQAPSQQPNLQRVEPALRAWFEAIQDGAAEDAWSMLTPEAQRIVGRDRFETLMQSDLPEGLGAFAGASEFHYVVIESQGARARVVGVAAGEITREASTEYAAMATPVVVEGDEVLIDDGIVDRARYYERMAVFASASLGAQPYREGDELIVELTDPRGALDAVIALEDGRSPLPTEFDASSGRVAATLERDLEAGTHIATMVVIADDGRLYPEAIVFEAAAPR